MNRPTLRTYLIGNPFSLVVCWLAFAFAAYQSWMGDRSLLAPFLLFMLASHASTANRQIAAYRRWCREWNAMRGEGATRGVGVAPIPGLRALLGVMVWGVAASYVLTRSDDPGFCIPMLLFWLASAAMATIIVVRMVRRLRRSRADRAVPVRVCLGRASGSPAVAETFSALPEYCAHLLAPANAAPK